MSTYLATIPASTDLISTSQGQLLTNFSQLNTQFGIEHTPFNNTGSNGDGLHKKATMPDTGSVTPATSYGTYYASKTGTVGGTITEAVYKSGDATSISILSAVKAWGTFSFTPTRLDGFNFASVTGGGAGATIGKYVVSFTNALPNASYAVLVTCQMATSFTTGGIIGVDSLGTASFQINVRALTSAAGSSAGPIHFVVLQS